jgi:predicted anti-sigma-YlaC factor YlaD
MRLWRRRRDRTAGAITCQQVVELVTDYLEGAMTPGETRRFDEHIALCGDCSRYLEQMRVTIRTVGRLDAESISPDARDALLHAFRDWNAQSSWS